MATGRALQHDQYTHLRNHNAMLVLKNKKRKQKYDSAPNEVLETP